ncbi:MAG TPA: hypothetical protein VGZ93_06115 [Candidatus Methylacidiphilales bacterium]|jgi:hypothetical protein|nr:hypothetical protein [Candidatus Methylacidiphilales bacterium]
MPVATFLCPKCKAALSIEPGTTEIASTCPQCASPIEAFFFPAFFRPMQVGTAATALADHTEASCFYHPQKQAMRVCDGCGRMICALCSIDLGAEHLCPNCLASGKKKGKITTLEDTRTRYDSIALSLAVFGMLFYVLSIFLAPAAIYISIRHWNSPGSLLGSSKIRFVIAILLATATLLFWFFVFGTLILHHPKT